MPPGKEASAMGKSRRENAAITGRPRLFGGLGEGESNSIMCEGCRLRRDAQCAACGARASVWTEAGDGKHAVAWCARCHGLLLSGRPENAPPLVYLSIAEAAIA
jgi:hypothetical protein